MVQKTLITILLLFPLLARAEINLDFNAVSIPEFAQAVLKGIIKRNYVLSPEVLSDSRTLTMSIKQAKEADILPLVEQLLDQNGIHMDDSGGILYLNKRTAVQPLPPDLPEVATQVQSAEAGDAAGTANAVTPPAPDLPVHSYRPRYRDQKEITDLLNFAGAKGVQAVGEWVFFKADFDSAENLQALLEQIDTHAEEVLVKAYLYEVSNTSRDVTAISAAISLLNGRLGLSLDGIQSANQLKLSISDAELVISAFKSDNRFKMVSSPSLRVKNGKNSRFTVGTETPTIASTTLTDAGQPIQSVQYRSSGVILEITPTIHEETIDLVINQQLSSFVPTTTGVNNSPTLTKREIMTTVSTTDGQLIILGGLDETRTSNQNLGFKFLPDFLRNKDKSEDKSDILLVMQVTRL